MARVSKERLNKIKNELGVNTLYSWSRYNTYKTSKYLYFLKYVKRAKATRESIYGISGGLLHQTIESLYRNEIQYDDMLGLYEDGLSEFNKQGLKYDRSDESKNELIANKYESCIRHFFTNHKVIDKKIELERFITIQLGDSNYHCMGYVDAIYKDDDENYCVTDWKSSTKYSGKKIDKEKGQLLLYGLGIHQMGVPLDRIKIQWNFLKYTDITFMQKNGKEKTMTAERHDWVRKIKSRLKTNLRELDWDTLDIELKLAECIEANSIDELPQEVKDLYTFDDCYVEAPFNKEEVDNLVDSMVSTFKEIEEKSEQYSKTKDDKLFFDTPEHVEEQSYFFANLMEYSPYQHKPYKMYLDDKQMFKKDDEKVDYGKQIDDTSDDDWLALLDL